MLCWKYIKSFSPGLKKLFEQNYSCFYLIVQVLTIVPLLCIGLHYQKQCKCIFYLSSFLHYLMCNFCGLLCSADSKQRQAPRFYTGLTEGPERRLSTVSSCSEAHTAVH